MLVFVGLPLLKNYRVCNFVSEIKLLLPKSVNFFGDTYNKDTLGP